ncbi:MAG TPA: NADH-quinone oxidoreductase subunit L [Deltaproteobacteria bacterium]|nr:NADH-quinone oxidoreductase subunit L [Deltaproteobacteria bacterium]
MATQLWLIPLFPLLGFVLNLLLGCTLGRTFTTLVGPLAVLAALGQSVWACIALWSGSATAIQETLWRWIHIGDLQIEISFQVDPLTAMFLLIITGIGFLIHVYSVGYMADEEHYGRFFAFLNLFVFFMLVLVLADNLLLMFVGWEGVGLCSYLLIGFYHEKISAGEAAKKAFLFNRVGDVGVLSAVMMLVVYLGTLRFDEINAQAGALGEGSLGVTLITLLLFLGATGKSAQVPLYVWLPDAMEGPTPVSALIHAATMVTAGLYLVAKLSFLFILAPFTLIIIAVLGTATAFLGATVALTQTDIKKVLAYSTVSQLGYMFLAMGVGAFGAGIFHVLTHAFFKALLFLGAGAVIHALHHEQDMRQMGGLRQKLPWTYATMLMGTLAISGIPLFSGFFSKDEILWSAYSSPFGSPALWIFGFLTAGLTSFYMFRMIYLTFHGSFRGAHEESIHEPPMSMVLPLIALAILAVFGGFLGVPHALHFLPNGMEIYFHGFFAEVELHGSVIEELALMVMSVVLAFIAWGLASRRYRNGWPRAIDPDSLLAGAERFSLQNWNVDAVYTNMVVRPFYHISFSVLWKTFDRYAIEGLLQGVAKLQQTGGYWFQQMQNGSIQHYATIFTVSTFLLLLWSQL